MTHRRWVVAVVLIAVTAVCVASLLVIGVRVRRVLRQTSAAIDAEENFAVEVRPIDLAAGSRFDWISAPAVFSGGAFYQGRLFLCGPSGLYEYSGSGVLLHI